MTKKNDNSLSIAYSNGESNRALRESSARDLTSLQLKTPNQRNYASQIDNNVITFGVGPAGTGKTHIAIIKGIDAILDNQFDQLLLFRPPVECGPKQGFLPGDLAEKTDPYMQALNAIILEYLGAELSKKLMDDQRIKVGYIGYIRGSTFNKSWVVLDEAQNTTDEQMKTFLTRIGISSKVVITGDKTQVDLPKHVLNGLEDAERRLQSLDGIAFATLEACDNQRNPLVTKILERYEN
jgi:phosphate starvation-inducible PhoH-like protein